MEPKLQEMHQHAPQVEARGNGHLRAFGRQRRESARFVGSNHFMTRQEFYVWWWTRIVEVIWDLFLPAASGAMLLFGGMAVLDGRLSLGDLMMFLVYLAAIAVCYSDEAIESQSKYRENRYKPLIGNSLTR